MQTIIEKLETNTSMDVITVHFCVTKENYNQYGKVILQKSKKTNYIPFNKLTESDVLKWVLGTPTHNRCVFLVNARIEKNKGVFSPELPWVKDEP